MPVFAWAVLVMAFMILFAFTGLIIASLLLELDRGFGTQFFNPERQLAGAHLFWIFGHPEVYIQFVPATGVVSMVVVTFARHRIVGYTWLVGSLVAIGFLSFSLWAHHMFAVGLPTLVLSSSPPPAWSSPCPPGCSSSPGWPPSGRAGRCGRRHSCSWSASWSSSSSAGSPG